MISKLYICLPIIFLFLLLLVFQNPTTVKTAIIYIIIFILSLLSGVLTISGHFKKGWPFLIEIFILTSGALSFFLFLNNQLWQCISVVIFCLFFSLFLKKVFAFIHLVRAYTPRNFERIIKIINFTAGYWVLSSFGALMDSDPFWLPSYLGFVLAFILFFWLIYFPVQIGFGRRDLWETAVVSLILSEIHLVVKFLPLGFYFNALIVCIIFIILILWIEKKNQKKLLLTI